MCVCGCVYVCVCGGGGGGGGGGGHAMNFSQVQILLYPDMKLLQHLQLCQRSEFWHVSVSERQRLRLRDQNLCGTFVRLYWQPTSKRAIRQWRPTA